MGMRVKVRSEAPTSSLACGRGVMNSTKEWREMPCRGKLAVVVRSHVRGGVSCRVHTNPFHAGSPPTRIMWLRIRAAECIEEGGGGYRWGFAPTALIL